MPQTTVDNKAVVKGLKDIERLEKTMKGLQAQVTTMQGSIPKATNSVRKFGTASRRSAGGVTKLAGALGEIAAFAGITFGAASLFQGLEKADKASAALRTLGADSTALNASLAQLRKELNNNVSQLELQQNAFAVMQANFKDTAEVTQILEAAVKSSQAKLIDTAASVTALTSVLNAYGLGASDAAEAKRGFSRRLLTATCP